MTIAEDRTGGQKWHCAHISDVVGALQTHLTKGLSVAEAQARFAQYGPNELKERPRPGFWQMLLAQFNNFLVILLLVAALISMVIGEFFDAAAIMAIVIFNAIIGVVQESKAENALAALKKMAAPNAQVIRDGHIHTIPARELVRGDVVLLEAGNFVPADLRLFESINLKIEEASLTGESVPAEKNAEVVLDREIPVGDRLNTAFMSTTVTYGRGKGIVVNTGMHTQIGLIAEMIQSYEEEQTPLQQKLAQLGKVLGIGALSICGLVFIVGVFITHEPILEMFMTAVSLAIAAVPEGLPAIVTICLALGMQRMLRRNALLRKLPAVETLGCATAICSDKTGTLTQNEMTVVKAFADGSLLSVTGEGYQPYGEFRRDGDSVEVDKETGLRLLLRAAILCNDSLLEQSGASNERKVAWRIIGDPTEGALVVAAAKAGLWKDEIECDCPRMGEVPFDSERKRMSTIHKEPSGEYVAYVKGAPDIVLGVCNSVYQGGQVVPLTIEKREEILKVNEMLAGDALRVLGVAYRPVDTPPAKPTAEGVERDLTFIGLLGMIDPARPEVKDAIRIARTAGIKTVMITGDYKNTAVAIAKDLNLASPEGRALTGADLDALDDDTFASIAESVDIYARVSPQHKVRIVEALKRRGHVVAMTGDGVNDAPALKRSNIGVAMGITGTDVAKETADMVLTDDNYASIVSAVEEGRVIYSNIRKFILFLLGCNVGEILIVFLTMLAGLPLPLRPIQLLWMNLITDGAPALALGMEKGDPDTMLRPPRPTTEHILNREMQIGIGVQSLFLTAAVIAAFVIGLGRFGDNVEGAQTMAFVSLSGSELLLAFSCRSLRHSAFAVGLFTNRWMWAAAGSSFLLLMMVVYVPFLDPIFHTVSLGWQEWAILAPLMFVPVIAFEVTKFFLRRGTPQTNR